jgi:hypothetical protein
METIDLLIPAMKSAHCELAVSNAVARAGAKVKRIYPSRLIVELADGMNQRIIIDAIEKAGYKVDNYI